MRSWFVPFGLRPKPEETGPRYGDTNDRTMAAVIDIALLFLLLNRISQTISDKVFAAFELSPLGSNAHAANFSEMAKILWEVRYPWLISNGIIVGLMALFVISCQMAYGTTPGKWLLGLKIVRHKTLEPIASWRYVLRFLAYIPASAPLMLGVIWMSFNKQRRGWHDYIAGTVVINTRPKGWYWQKVKLGYRWLMGKMRPSSRLAEKPMGEPSAKQGHEDGSKPID